MNANALPEDETARILAQAAAWLQTGQEVALATVTATWGSSPRPVGGLLAVSATGDFVGSVSGGCVEAAVIEAAAAVIATTKPRQLEFGVSDEQAWDVGLACGGSIGVYVERIELAMIAPLLEAGAGRRGLARVVMLDSGESALYRPGDAAEAFSLGAPAATAAQAALDDRRSTLAGLDAGSAFIRVFIPPPRLIVVGAVHIAQYLVSVAALAGFEVTLVDPRRAFASRERFPQVAAPVTEWPDKALRRLAPDAQTAVVTLTHDPKLDEPALRVALESPAFYIGALGSKRTHAARRARLIEAGFDDAQLERIHAPIGLDLGGRAPAEIAIAIVAEAIQVLHKGDKAPKK